MRNSVFLLVFLAACQFDAQVSGASARPEQPGSSSDAGSQVDAGSALVPDAATPPTVDAAGPDASLCPAQCDSCEGDGTCVISCQGDDDCSAQIQCPADRPCLVECTGENACAGGVTCSTQACRIECAGDSCGGEILCQDSCACDVLCQNSGSGNCGDIDAECPEGNSCEGNDDLCRSNGCSSCSPVM